MTFQRGHMPENKHGLPLQSEPFYVVGGTGLEPVNLPHVKRVL